MSDDDDDFEIDEVDQTTALGPSAWHGRTADDLLSTPRGLPVQDSDELTRIINLPRREVVTEGSTTALAHIELQMLKYSRGERQCECHRHSVDVAAGKRKCIKRFLWTQAWPLHEITTANGLFLSLAVGGGKTLIWMLSALALRNCPLALMLVPPTLIEQTERNWLLIAEHFRVPNLVVHYGEKRSQGFSAPPNPHTGLPEQSTVHVLAYTGLSSIKRSTWIDHLQPSAIIADEVDALKDMNAARTMRLMRYFDENRATRFVCGTGSPLDNSINEVAHLMALALRRGSPLPIIREVIDDWSRALDPVPNPCPVGALRRLLGPGEGIHDVRRALRRRISETPGVVFIGGRQPVITSSGAPVEVRFAPKPAPPLPPIIEEALARVRANLRPDSLLQTDDNDVVEDEILVDPLEKAKCAREVATGLLYRWVFLPINGVPQRRDDVIEWYRRRKAFFAELRAKVLRGEAMLDSPGLCLQAARRYWGDDPRSASLPEWKSEHWPEWRDFQNVVVPTPEARRLHPYLVEDALSWAINNRGVIWYSMSEFAQWAHEKSIEWGYPLPMFGEGSAKAIANHRGETSIIASLKSHGRGLDGLQFRYDKNLVVNTMASSRLTQQLAGRTRRRGQESELVEFEIYLHTDELRGTFEQVLRRSEFVTELSGEQQEVLMGWEGY